MCDDRFNLDIVSHCPAVCHFQFAKKMLYWLSIQLLAPVTDTDND